MQALVLDDTLSLRDVDAPVAAPGEALIRVQLAGVCGTDLAMVRGYKGTFGVLGHEFVGMVVACDDPSWLGARVVGEINLGCGACWACAAGRGRHCVNRRVLGILDQAGCFASHTVLPIRNLHRVPDDMDDIVAVFCEPLAAALHAVGEATAELGEVAVVGDGRLGLLHVLALRALGRDVVLYGRHPHKLEIARQVGARVAGADTGFEPAHDLVIEATGSAEGALAALARVRACGTLVLKSTVTHPIAWDTNRLVVDELRVEGSRCGPFEPALELLASGRLDPRPLIEGILPLSRGLEAFELAAKPGALKWLLLP